MSHRRYHVVSVIVVILATVVNSNVRAAVDITYDDRVLYLNGYIDGFDGFDEYFGDAFASPTGEFVSPEFSRIINDGRSSFFSFVSSGTEIEALIELDPAGTASFTGTGLSYADVLADPKDANGGSAFGSSEFDVDLLLTDTTYRFSFAGSISSTGSSRTSASLYEGTSLSGQTVFDLDTNTGATGSYEFAGLLKPGAYRLDIFSTAYINIPTAPGDETGRATYDFAMSLVPAPGDFNQDGAYSCADVDALVAAIVDGDNPADFDLTGDGKVDLADRDAWLAEAGALHASGTPFPLGDANLDGNVDQQDYAIWSANKFTNQAAWCLADFTADGNVDGFDLLEWNRNKFASPDGTIAIPEPTTGLLLMVLFTVPIWRRR